MQPPELQTLRIEIDGEIGTLTLDRPESFNAMSADMILELGTAFAWLADEAPLRALIVTGAGPAFCSGGDINWFRKGVEDDSVDLPASVRRGAEALHSAIVDLRRIPYPVICALNGPAAGAGFSLALACDIRIASEKTFLACAYGRIGASPDGGMTYFLPRVVGPSRALEILLEDPNMTAADALEQGLVSAVVAPDELIDSARAKAAELAKKAPHYVRMAKLLVGQSIENRITEHLQLERHGIADSMATEDLREGAIAFFSGEEPEFKGR
jgi:2-(1,2-epoxy-1,2-dihydrophenyl)acetyl-CoA isomerase